MALAAGDKVGPYEILASIGAGGMGEVYRARDPRLKREVAVKILPGEVASDPVRRQRFEQEARAVAALNHPNIVAIYDVGEESGVFFMVTELVDGESLRGARFGLRKTLDCAVQIAGGLAAAHAAAIVHRDLKPDNILLTRDGRIKILDFGLAKMVPVRSGSGETDTFTVQTEAGVVLGTVGYMSPEQVKGQPTDHRSDIFSFGVILYELLGGRRAFRGETAVETMTAILKQDPPDLPDAVPSAMRQVVNHCLEKEPGNRFQSARDLSFALGTMSQGSSPSGATLALQGRSKWLRRTLAAAAVLALVAAAVAGTRFLWPVAQAPSWSGGILGGPEMAMDPRLSPDGHLLAFQAMDRGIAQVAVMKPETGNWSTLTHVRELGVVQNLCWSPDGASIYYDRVTDVPHGIFSVPVLGGEEKLILENAVSPEALSDGTLLVSQINARRQLQLFRFWPESGRLQGLPVVFPNLLQNFYVRAFTDAKQALAFGVVLGSQNESQRLLSVDLVKGTARPLPNAPESPTGVTVSPDGRSVLAAVPAGSLTRVVSIPIAGRGPVQNLFTVANILWYLDAAPDGSIYTSLADRPAELVRRSVRGDQTETVASFPLAIENEMIAVLPDGRTVLTLPVSGKRRLMVIEKGKEPVSLITTTEETSGPLALARPREIAFLLGSGLDIIGIADTATGRITQRVSPGKGPLLSLAASPDGKTLYFTAGSTIWTIPSSGGEAHMIGAGDFITMDPSGQSLVVSAEESSRLRLFRVFLDGRPEQEISTDGSAPIMNFGRSPGALSADGRLLVPLMDAWFNRPATLDLATGRITRLPSDDNSDYHGMVWLSDGQIMALHIGLRSTLWKFQPSAASK